LRELLSNHEDIEVVAEATSLQQIEKRETEVILMASVSPPVAGGVSSARLDELELDDRAVLLLTDHVEDAKFLLAAKTRAWGVLSLNVTEDELAAAIRAVAEGLWVGAAGLMSGLMRDEGRIKLMDGDSPSEPLTAREKEVLQLMAEGLANKQIALSLGISEHTVKFHLSSLYAKLNVSSRTEAIRKGLGLGLLSI
jgi:DNA-binding NarL/FixJ family response regulator